MLPYAGLYSQRGQASSRKPHRAWSESSHSRRTLPSIRQFSHLSGLRLVHQSTASTTSSLKSLTLTLQVSCPPPIGPGDLSVSPQLPWPALRPRLARRGSVPRASCHPSPACLPFCVNFTPAERGGAGERRCERATRSGRGARRGTPGGVGVPAGWGRRGCPAL